MITFNFFGHRTMLCIRVMEHCANRQRRVRFPMVLPSVSRYASVLLSFFSFFLQKFFSFFFIHFLFAIRRMRFGIVMVYWCTLAERLFVYNTFVFIFVNISLTLTILNGVKVVHIFICWYGELIHTLHIPYRCYAVSVSGGKGEEMQHLCLLIIIINERRSITVTLFSLFVPC